MVVSCRDLLLVLLLTFAIFLVLSWIMVTLRPASATACAGGTGVFLFAMWKRENIKQKIKALDENIADLERLLHNAEKSLEDVLQKIAILTNQKVLENQREQFKLEMEDVQTKMEEIKERIQSLERKIAKRKEIDKTEEHLAEKQRQLNALWKLERKKEELDKLQLNTEKLLQRTEAESFVILTERKRKLRSDMKQLEKAKKEREELARSWFLIF